MVRRLRIRSKLALVVALPLVGLMLLSLIGWQGINKTKIGSSTYGEILVAQNLLADSKAPSQYINGAFLEVHELVLSEDPAVQAKHIAELDELKKDFYAQHEVWVATLATADRAPIAAALTDEAYKPADAFFKTVDNELLPLVKDGDLDKAQALVAGDLEDLYDEHEEAIAKVEQLAWDYQAKAESEAADTVNAAQLILLVGIFSLIVTVGALGFLLYRSIGSSIASLTRRARYAATEELPLAVARVQEGDESALLLAPIEVDGDDELAELAQAMSTMQQTAVDIAAEQARLRRNVSEMFVNLGRRNQSLLNRTLAFITELERNERDPEVLDDLFRLDHLATRMRRNAESLLVLAGAEAARTWSQPVDLADVVRSALSEVESYDRVDLTVLDKVAVKGTAVADVAHLLAELIENAAVYSPPHSRVNVVGKVSNDGYLISVIDQGIGMASDDLAEANRRIDEVARFDTSPSRVLGLFVVGRLAARHGIQVRLVESATEGVTAKVKLPMSLLVGEERQPLNPALDERSYANQPALPAEVPAVAASSLESWLDDGLEPMAPPISAWDETSDHDVAASWAAGSADASASLWSNAPVNEEPLWTDEQSPASGSLWGEAADEAPSWTEPAAEANWAEPAAVANWAEPAVEANWAEPAAEANSTWAETDTTWTETQTAFESAAPAWGEPVVEETTADSESLVEPWDTAAGFAPVETYGGTWPEAVDSTAVAADLGWDAPFGGTEDDPESPVAFDDVASWPTADTDADWSAPAPTEAPATVLGGTDWALGAPVAEWAADSAAADSADATADDHTEALPERPSFAARSNAVEPEQTADAGARAEAALEPLPLSPNAAALWATGAGRPILTDGSDAVDTIADLGAQPAVAPVPPPPPPLADSAVMEIWPNGEAPVGFEPSTFEAIEAPAWAEADAVWGEPATAAMPEALEGFTSFETVDDLAAVDSFDSFGSFDSTPSFAPTLAELYESVEAIEGDSAEPVTSFESFEATPSFESFEPTPSFESFEPTPSFESFEPTPSFEDVSPEVVEAAGSEAADVIESWAPPVLAADESAAWYAETAVEWATPAENEVETASQWDDVEPAIEAHEAGSPRWLTDEGGPAVAPPPPWPSVDAVPTSPVRDNADNGFRQADFGPGGFAGAGSPVPPPPPFEPTWATPVVETIWDTPAVEAPAWDTPAVPVASVASADEAQAIAGSASWEPPVAELPVRRQAGPVDELPVRRTDPEFVEAAKAPRVVETFGWVEREAEVPALPDDDQAPALPDDDEVRTASGLTRRVRGAHLPDTGPQRNRRDGSLPGRSPEEIRRALSSFQMGKLRGTRDAGNEDQNDDQGGAAA